MSLRRLRAAIDFAAALTFVLCGLGSLHAQWLSDSSDVARLRERVFERHLRSEKIVEQPGTNAEPTPALRSFTQYTPLAQGLKIRSIRYDEFADPPAYDTSVTILDSNLHLKRILGADERTTRAELVYDSLRRVHAILFGDAALGYQPEIGLVAHSLRYHYDASNRTDSVLFLDTGSVVLGRDIYTYDDQGRRVRIQTWRGDELLRLEDLAYDSAGHLLERTLRTNGVHRTVYRYSTAGDGIEEIDYGPDGKQTSKTISEYDDDHRVMNRTTFEEPSGHIAFWTIFHYDHRSYFVRGHTTMGNYQAGYIVYPDQIESIETGFTLGHPTASLEYTYSYEE